MAFMGMFRSGLVTMFLEENNMFLLMVLCQKEIYCNMMYHSDPYKDLYYFLFINDLATVSNTTCPLY